MKIPKNRPPTHPGEILREDFLKPMELTQEKLAEEYKGKVKIGKFDVDENPEVAGKYEIQSIPTIIFFKDGNMVDKMVGFQSGEALKQKLDAL